MMVSKKLRFVVPVCVGTVSTLFPVQAHHSSESSLNCTSGYLAKLPFNLI